MSRSRLTLVTVLLAVVGAAAMACSTGGATSPTDSETGEPAPSVLPFGATHTWPGGDTITVAAPTVRSAHGAIYVVLDITVRNAGPQAKTDASYIVRADIDGVDAPWAGIEGINAPTNSYLASGDSKRFQMAFEAPAQPATVKVQAFGMLNDPQRPVVFFRS